MRVCHVVPSLDPGTGGPAVTVPALCRALAARGVEVTLYATGWPREGVPEEIARRFAGESFALRLFAARRGPLRGRLPWSEVLRRDLLAHLREQPTVVHVHSLWNPLASMVMRDLRLDRRPYLLSSRGMLDPVVLARNAPAKRLWAWAWERANVEQAASLHCTTQAEAEKARRCGWRLPEIVVVPNSVEWAHWQNLPSPQTMRTRYPQLRGREVILFVGRLNWVKNLPVLVRALAVLRRSRPDTLLLLAGPDEEGVGEELERLATELGMAGALVRTGMLDREGLRAAMACADAGALISLKENFGMGAAESLAAGIPVVLSHGVDLGVTLNSAAVRRVEARPEAVAGALQSLLQAGGARGSLGEEARRLAWRQWGETALDPLLAAYAKAGATSGGGVAGGG
ncbi:MAG: glycosyltransferase [Magnetococcales bacterium]|nr:glycosyltransferase [Magnetococcales bacterium]